jgi:hypothetical protein
MSSTTTLGSCILVLFSVLISYAGFTVASLVPLNITVPDGTTNHGNPQLICTPATALNIVVFFVGNYFTHAGTVTTRPGASSAEQFLVTFAALLFPGSGLVRGCAICLRFLSPKSLWERVRAAFNNGAKADIDEQQELKTAARAGALCILIRTQKWRPQSFTSNEELGHIKGCFLYRKKRHQSGMFEFITVR